MGKGQEKEMGERGGARVEDAAGVKRTGRRTKSRDKLRQLSSMKRLLSCCP